MSHKVYKEHADKMDRKLKRGRYRYTGGTRWWKCPKCDRIVIGPSDKIIVCDLCGVDMIRCERPRTEEKEEENSSLFGNA